MQRSDEQRNTRVGGTLSVPLRANQSLKVAYSTGTTTRIGGDFDTIVLAWQAWSVLNNTRSRARVPSSWILHNGTIHSFTDPEDSRLQDIIDVGALESNHSAEWAEATDPDRLRLFVQLLNGALHGVDVEPDAGR